MKLASPRLAPGLLLFAALLGTAAWIRADDGSEELSDPLPLFAPADSIRLLPGEANGADDASIESKEELYERLRQSLLRLEQRLQAQEQSVTVPEPPDVAHETPQDVATAEPDAQTEHQTTTAPGIDVTPPPMSVHTPGGQSSDHHEGHAEHPESVHIPIDSAPHATHADEESDFEAQGSPNLAALADNLYALGEYALAYNTYGQIDIESAHEEDKIWVTYQKAGCLRHQGLTDDAAPLYRSLLSEYPDHHLTSISAFWLDTMAEGAEHHQSMAELREAMTEVQEFRDAALQP